MAGVEVKPRKGTNYTVLVSPVADEDHEHFATCRAWYEWEFDKAIKAHTPEQGRNRAQEALMAEYDLHPVLYGEGFHVIIIAASKLTGAGLAQFEEQEARVNFDR